MKAKITTTHSRGRSPKAGLTSLQRQIKSAIKARGLNIPVRKTNEAIFVNMGFPEKELRGALDKGSVEYHIEIIEENKPESTNNKSNFPEDYGRLKGKVNKQKSEISELNGTISQLEGKVLGEKKQNEALRTKLRGSIKYEDMNVYDFLSEVMLRENQSWNAFVESYEQTLAIASETTDIPINELEAECLNYEPLEQNKEFKKIKHNLEKARTAKKLSDENKYVQLNQEAAEILEKEKQILEKSKKIINVRDELGIYTTGKQTRVAINVKENETLVTLPFNKTNGYHRLERELINNIDTYLSSNNLKYAQEDFNGLLRYNISGIKKRARNKLIKTISETQDSFTKLCGERKVIRVETC